EHVAELIREASRVGVMQIVNDRGRKRQAGDPRARLVIYPEGVPVVRLVVEVRDVTARELVLEVLTDNLDRHLLVLHVASSSYDRQGNGDARARLRQARRLSVGRHSPSLATRGCGGASRDRHAGD